MGVLLILLGPLDVMLPMFCKHFFWTGSQFGSFLLHSNQIFFIFICSFRFRKNNNQPRKKQQLYSHVSAHPSVEMAADRLFRQLPCQHECRMTYPALLPLLVALYPPIHPYKAAKKTTSPNNNNNNQPRRKDLERKKLLC